MEVIVQVPAQNVKQHRHGIVMMKQAVKQQEGIGVIITVLVMNALYVPKISHGIVMIRQVAQMPEEVGVNLLKQKVHILGVINMNALFVKKDKFIIAMIKTLAKELEETGVVITVLAMNVQVFVVMEFAVMVKEATAKLTVL